MDKPVYKASATNYPYLHVRAQKEGSKKEYEASEEISKAWAMKMAQILINDPLSTNVDKWCQAMRIPTPVRGEPLTAEEAEKQIEELNKKLFKTLEKIIKIKEKFKKH